MTTRSPDIARPGSTAPWCVPIFVVTFLAYFPVLQAGFIWDDMPGHVTRPELRSLAGLGRIWSDVGATQQYYPLLHSVFWVEHRLWGDAPLGYHLINVLLHAMAACLAGTVLRRLAVPGAWLAALLFALHPVCVESVAWVSEQKNTLSAVLYLCAALVHVRFDEDRRSRSYLVASGLFLLALFTKTVTATLPAALLVIVWWRRGRIDWRRDVVPLVPWFALSLGAGALTAWVEHTHIGALGTDFTLAPLDRVVLAGRAVCFYFGKLVWPANLIFIYPRWTIDATQAWQWSFPLGVALVVVACWLPRRRRRAPLAAALFFIGTLFPALGFVNVFPFLYSFVADHFQYLASLGLLALAAAGVARIAARAPKVVRGAAVLVLATFGVLTWQNARTYRDVFVLYETTLAKNPACWMAHTNLAIALVESGRAADAPPHYEQALALRPRYAEGENNFGFALIQLGRAAEAVPHLRRAIEFRPTYAEAHNNLGSAFMALSRPDDGIVEFTEATRLNPRDAVAHFNLGLGIASSGKPADAISHFQQAVRLDPNYADAELNWAIALTVTQHVPEALPHFGRALELNPNSAHAHATFGRALASIGRYDEADQHLREAQRLGENR